MFFLSISKTCTPFSSFKCDWHYVFCLLLGSCVTFVSFLPSRHFVHLRRPCGSFQDPLQSAKGRCQNRQAGTLNGEDRGFFRSVHCSSIHRHRLLSLPAVSLGRVQRHHPELIRGIRDASNLHVAARRHHIRDVDLVSENPPHLAALLCTAAQRQPSKPRWQEGAGRGLDQTREGQRDSGVKRKPE